MTWTTEPPAEQVTTKAANNNIFLYFRISGVRRSKQRIFRRTPETVFHRLDFLFRKTTSQPDTLQCVNRNAVPANSFGVSFS